MNMDHIRGNIKNTPVIRPLVTDTTGAWYKRLYKWCSRTVQYEVMEDYYYKLPKTEITVYIPKGFVFDGASIPKFLWPIIAPIDVLIIPAVIHDFGYKYNTLITADGFFYLKNAGRAAFDELFKNLSLSTNGLKITSTLAYNSIAIFGIIPWNQKRKDNRKIRKDFPELIIKDK